MKPKAPNIRLIYACGLIPLVGGLTIFFLWWGGKTFFAKNLNGLEDLGFSWILLSILIALFGLAVGLYNIFKYRKSYLRQTILGILFILLNIPVVGWVLDKQSEIEKRTYLKFINNSNKDNLTLEVYDSKLKKQIGTINNNKSKIYFFIPTILSWNDSAPIYDSLKLIVSINQRKDTLQLPEYYPGECHKVYLDKDFKIISKW